MAEPFAYEKSLPKVDRSKLSEYPTLSMKERDRHWDLVRAMMEQHNVEALVVLQGFTRWDDASSYITGEPPGKGSIVFFPLLGDPIVFEPADLLVIDTLMKSEAYGIKSWVSDWRYGEGSTDDWVAVLKERKLHKSAIGIVGSGTFSHHMQAMIASALTNSIKSVLPAVTFVDLWRPFVHIMLVKHQEEIAVFRKAALALEVAAEEFVAASKPGNTVGDVENAFVSALIPYGVDIWRLQNAVCSIGFGPDGGRGVTWLAHGLKPPVIERGNLLSCEIFANVGLMHGQVQMTVSVGKPKAEKVKLAALAREAYETAVAMIRPGITFGEVVNAMGRPNERESAWDLSPFIHSMNPHEAVSNITRGIGGPHGFTGVNERFPRLKLRQHDMERADLVIEEGMLFQLEPNACYGRTYVNIGGNVLVTKGGCEELNRIPTRMVVVDA